MIVAGWNTNYNKIDPPKYTLKKKKVRNVRKRNFANINHTDL